MVREILVVKKDLLFGEKYFQGFCPIDEKDYLEIVLNNFEYQERNDLLENNPDFQQIIPYVWIINKKEGRVFLYKRAKTGNEGRLHDKYS
ncbi:MAG: phosphoesterase, partial [Nanoarchaeota archaeon]